MNSSGNRRLRGLAAVRSLGTASGGRTNNSHGCVRHSHGNPNTSQGELHGSACSLHTDGRYILMTPPHSTAMYRSPDDLTSLMGKYPAMLAG